MGIEIHYMREIICHKMLISIVTAPLHCNESDTIFNSRSEPDFQIQIVQFFEKAACGDKLQVTKVVRKVICNRLPGGF